MSRIVLFGATGYTGRLVAEGLVDMGARPVLAARSRDKLEALAADLGGDVEVAVADVEDPASVRALVEEGDVLVSTVGPFARWGAPAADAAVDARAHYIDSTGEPAWIRRVWESYGPRAARAGVGMLTAAGYDYVPGNLAGGLALDRAGDAADSVAVGYFTTGKMDRSAMSGGTAASLAGTILEPGFAYRDGALRSERGARRVRHFEVRGKDRAVISVGGTEHFALPRAYPGLRTVDVGMGWAGPASRAVQIGALGTDLTLKLPPARMVTERVLRRLIKGSTGGPDAETRSRSGSRVVAVAHDRGGRELATVHVTGTNAYSFTGDFMAWAAIEVSSRGWADGATGALGPVDGFGLERLEEGCAETGISASEP